jgi:hypothetical protein
MSKVRPVVPPKPARLSIGPKKRDTISSTYSRESITESIIESPPATPVSPNDIEKTAEDKTPRASEIFSQPVGRQARALYNFEGEASYQELSFKAGDVINVLKEHLSEGWSLAEKDGITGLVPESYITVSFCFLLYFTIIIFIF